MRVLFALVVVCLSLTLVAANAPLLGADAKAVIPGQYLVVFHRNSTVAIRDFHVAELVSTRFTTNDKIRHIFDIGTLIGYSATLSKETLAAELAHPNVRYIEADQVVTINDEVAADTATTQTGVLAWGIDRIDSADLKLDNTYTYWSSGGTGVTVYIIDTGILLTHQEFEGRATFGYSAITNEANTDLNGHGTHVAGTVAGMTYGVAKKANLVAVKVLSASGSGSWDGVIAGINYVTKRHTDSGKGTRSVANMSLGGGTMQTVDDAVTESVNAGVNHAIAAGNNNANACNYSPARAAAAVTVGATTNTDARASFSNIGTCVDVFAPGNNILSAWIGANNMATNTISGTSMASPHVAGVIAVRIGHLLAEGGLEPPTPTELHGWILSNSTKDKVTSPGTGSPNNLLFSPFTDAPKTAQI